MPVLGGRRSLRLPLITVAILSVLAGTSAAQGRREARIGIPGVPAALDPATALSGPVPLIARQVFDTLVAYREGTTDIEPGLASRWTVSRDGLTWSFTIRDNVTFHDGTPLTAREVLQSFERLFYADRPGSPSSNVVWPALLRGLPGVVKELSAPDDHTFRIMLVQPYAPLATVLAHPGFGVTRLATGPDGQPRLIGTGPYRLAEIAPGRIALDAARPVTGNRFERLVFSEVATDDQADAAFAAHALDLWFPSDPPRRQDGALSVPGTRIGLLVMQTEKEPFARKKARQAIATALDPTLIGVSLDGSAVPLQSFLPPGVWGQRSALPVLGGNRDAARKLFAEAGWPRGFTPALLVPGQPGATPGVKVAESITIALGAASIPIITRVEPPETVRALTQAGDYDLALVEASVAGGDPHLCLYPLTTTEGATKGANATNVSFYRNPRLDDVLIRASQLAFRPERLRLYARAQAMLADELPWIPIYVRLHWAVVRPDVRGLRLHPTGFHRLDTLTLETLSTAP
jgi:peptide/nickel transport system substrate-binding protein